MGARREPPKQKSPAAAAAAAVAPNKAATDKLIQLLIKKGLITPEEGRSLNQP
jgi:polyhydroxyalkanoate synthesis regulator phasin